MNKHYDLGTIGAPRSEHRHHGVRKMASLVAALCGGTAIMVVGFLLIGGPSAITNVWAWLLLAALVAVWCTGIWWRWDSPDWRKKTNERERRGF